MSEVDNQNHIYLKKSLISKTVIAFLIFLKRKILLAFLFGCSNDALFLEKKHRYARLRINESKNFKSNNIYEFN